MRDCHSIVGLYTYQNRVPFAPSLRWVSCKERDRLPHEGANFHSSFVHYREISGARKFIHCHTTTCEESRKRTIDESLEKVPSEMSKCRRKSLILPYQ